MAITKDKKKELLEQYVRDLQQAENTYMINQHGISVDLSTKIRKEMKEIGAKINVVRKRIFYRAIEEAGLEKIDLENLSGAALAIYVPNGDFATLKIIEKYNKEIKKVNENAGFSFLGGWSEKHWKDGQFVKELATIPSKEELISKFLYLLKYPIQSFASVVHEVAKKQG